MLNVLAIIAKPIAKTYKTSKTFWYHILDSRGLLTYGCVDIARLTQDYVMQSARLTLFIRLQNKKVITHKIYIIRATKHCLENTIMYEKYSIKVLSHTNRVFAVCAFQKKNLAPDWICQWFGYSAMLMYLCHQRLS